VVCREDEGDDEKEVSSQTTPVPQLYISCLESNDLGEQCSKNSHWTEI